MSSDAPFLLACRRQKTPFTPIWIMRQAGRYLPEYRAVRQRFSFLELCKTPEAAAEVTIQPIDLVGTDAAILFADILLILEPLGLGLEFSPGDGPSLANPIRSPEQVAKMPRPDVQDSLSYVYETIRQVRSGLADRVPLIGFAGAPFTLASYAIEGGGSRNYLTTKRFLLEHPEAWNELMARLVDVTVDYLSGQVDAGAQALQIFDSWVGHLGPDDYRTSVLPHMQNLFSRLPKSVPVIHFGTGTLGLLELMTRGGGDVIGLDWRVPLSEGWRRIGHDHAVQGNLDPAILFAPFPVIREKVRALLAEADGRPGHIANLGHGVLPNTPVDGVRCLVDTVHELSTGA
ncbi:MAG: uroporphyrinogen decarboxylase [Candidatus Binatia bacterium]|nr:uroporphyrinogen decarboxylase [Candidatus Binatia bacterium]